MTVTTLWFWALLGTAVWWVWTCGRLFEHLHAHHPGLYEWMGRKTFFVEKKRIDPVKLLRFLFGKYGETIDDDRVFGFRARLRTVGMLFCACLVGFILFLVAGSTPA